MAHQCCISLAMWAHSQTIPACGGHSSLGTGLQTVWSTFSDFSVGFCINRLSVTSVVSPPKPSVSALLQCARGYHLQGYLWQWLAGFNFKNATHYSILVEAHVDVTLSNSQQYNRYCVFVSNTCWMWVLCTLQSLRHHPNMLCHVVPLASLQRYFG